MAARRSLSQEDRVLKRAQALLAIDPQRESGARRLSRKRAEAVELIDLLAAQDHIEEACELGLLLEQALERLGEPPGVPRVAPAADEAPSPPGAASVPSPAASRYSLMEHLLGVARAAGHPFYEGEMLLRQAELYGEHGDHEQAQGLYGQVQAIAQGAELGLLEVAALAGQAALAQKEGNLFKAHGLYAKQRAQAAALGEVIFESQALANLAATALAMGDFRRGARYARERAQLSAELGDERGRAEALGSLGLAQRNLGDLDGGRRSYQEALRVARKSGSEALEAAVCYNFACLLSAAEPRLAAALLDHGARLARRLGAKPLVESISRAAQALEAQAAPELLRAARRDAPELLRALLE